MSGYYTGSWYVDNRIADVEFNRQYKVIQKEFKKLELRAKKSKVSFSSTVIDSPQTVKALINYAKNKKFDLVVMGSHGRTGWDKLILGSIANGVANRVHCPVMLVK